MNDIEKTIKALESLDASMHEHQCYTCSFNFIKTAHEFGTEIVGNALELLKKQIPLQPYTDGDVTKFDGNIYCRNCCKLIEREYKFCPNCGKAINWESEEVEIGMFPYDKIKK